MTPRLCLIAPPELVSGGAALRSFRETFAAALGAGDVASVLLSTDGLQPEEKEGAVQLLCPLAQEAGAAFLVQGDADRAHQWDCDGVQLPADPKEIKRIRGRYGDDMIIGADCGTSRHAGMLAGEAGCDYVAFSTEDREGIAWWAELMEVPCIAYGSIDLQNAPDLVTLGADFLAVDTAVWQHPEGAAAAVAHFNRLLGGS